VDAARVAALRELLASTSWVERTRGFARTMRTSTTLPSGLLLVGTPDDEPWHLTAHLSDEAQLANLPQMRPTLIRWQAEPDAPAHLAVTVQRLEHATRGETVVVVAEEDAPEGLLQRAWDARKAGATVLSLDGGDTELHDVAHESLSVVTSDLVEVSFDSVQHLVSAAVGEVPVGSRRGFRDRLGRMLDTMTGPRTGR